MAGLFRNKGFLTSRVPLFTVIVVCLQTGSAKGNSVTTLRAPSGVFQSPGYPDLDDDMRCTWKIIRPQNHKIEITFLDFQLVSRPICYDEVEIQDGNTKSGPYRGTSLLGDTMISSGNTMSIVLTSCSTSLLSDRRGIRVSYSSIPLTTLEYKTSKMVITTPRPATKAMSTGNILTTGRTFTSLTVDILSNASTIAAVSPTPVELSTRLRHSGGYKEQDPVEGFEGFLPVILAGLFVLILILIIIAIVIIKRRRTKHSSNVTTTLTSNTGANHERANSSNVVGESTAVENSQLESRYAQGPEIRSKKEKNVRLEESSVIFLTKISTPRLKKKHPMFNKDNDICVYENNASYIYDNTDFDEDYGAVSCTFQQASPKVVKRESQPKCSDINSDEGVIINTVYEPYLTET